MTKDKKGWSTPTNGQYEKSRPINFERMPFEFIDEPDVKFDLTPETRDNIASIAAATGASFKEAAGAVVGAVIAGQNMTTGEPVVVDAQGRIELARDLSIAERTHIAARREGINLTSELDKKLDDIRSVRRKLYTSGPAEEFVNYSSMSAQEVEERIKNNVLDTMMCLGLDPEADLEIQDTPRRVMEMWKEFNQGMPMKDLHNILGPVFKSPRNGTGGVVCQHGIPYRGLCAHHWAPYFGTCSIGYLPNKRVVGLSKFTRLVQAIGTLRPSNQEETTNMIADVIHEGADTKGVIVVTRALHTCMCVRGVNAPNVYTTVSAVRDNFIHNASLKAEFFAMYEAQP